MQARTAKCRRGLDGKISQIKVLHKLLVGLQEFVGD